MIQVQLMSKAPETLDDALEIITDKDELIKTLEDALIRVRDEPQAALRHYPTIARYALTKYYRAVSRNELKYEM